MQISDNIIDTRLPGHCLFSIIFSGKYFMRIQDDTQYIVNINGKSQAKKKQRFCFIWIYDNWVLSR